MFHSTWQPSTLEEKNLRSDLKYQLAFILVQLAMVVLGQEANESLEVV